MIIELPKKYFSLVKNVLEKLFTLEAQSRYLYSRNNIAFSLNLRFGLRWIIRVNNR